MKTKLFRTIVLAAAWLAAQGNVEASWPRLNTELPAREVLLDNGEHFQIFEDATQPGRLHLVPKNLHIARDENGQPKVSVILVRDTKSGMGTVTAHGYIWMTVTIGAPATPALYDRIRAHIDARYPGYKGAILSPITFKPGTAQVGFQVRNSAAPITWVPITAPVTVGSEFPLMIPITPEHGEILRQTASGKLSDLGISIYYKADSTFALDPSTVEVTANKKEIYNYFHEKSSSGGGFWIFSWNSQRETIREHFEKTGDVKAVVTKGDSGLLKSFGGVEYLKDLVNEMKGRAVDFVADIEVDRSNIVPAGGYERRPGRITLFSPSFYWTFSAWAGSSNASVDIQRLSEGVFRETFEIRGQEDLPITLANAGVTLPASVIKVVDLLNGFNVREFLSVDGFPAGAWSADGVQRGTIEVSIGKPGPGVPKYVFNFDAAAPGGKTSGYWRDATFTQGKDGLILPVLPDLYVKGTITTKTRTFESPLVMRRRTDDPFTPQVIPLGDIFDTLTISAEALYDENPGIGIIQVELRREGPNAGADIYTLRRTSVTAFAPFLKNQVEKRAYRLRVITGSSVGPWGAWRDATNQTQVFVAKADISQ